MSNKKQSVFAQQIEAKEDSFVEKASKAITKEVTTAQKILGSAHILFRDNLFPKETEEGEKQMLKNILISLHKSTKKAQENKEDIKKISQKKKHQAQEKIKQVEKEFTEITEQMARENREKRERLQKEEKEILETLEQLKQQYEAKKKELEEKNLKIIAEKENIKTEGESEQQMAQNALQKALDEIKNTKLSREEIEKSAEIFETLQKNINRAKGSLEVIFSDPKHKAILEKLFHGDFAIENDISAEIHGKNSTKAFSLSTQT